MGQRLFLKKYIRLLKKIVAVPILFLLCLPVVSEDKKEEDAFTKWYEIYYEAQDYSKQEKWLDAIDDFHLVLVVQPKDRRNAKTYGMNFIREFTPNRDLGIAYYNTGDYESAKKYLEISYKQLPTDLTKEYLEKVKGEFEKDILVGEHFKNGLLHFEKKEYELAIKEMQEVLKIRPDYEIAKKYIERANSLIKDRRRLKK